MVRAEFEEIYGKLIDGKYHVEAPEQGVLRLPENLRIPGDLVLPPKGICELPAHLTVEGSLNLSETGIIEIGPYLTVKGFLNLAGSKVRKLPDHVSVGRLKTANSELLEIGSHLTVDNSLDLAGSTVTSIGPHLTVNGVLYLGGSKLVKLSDHVRVKRLDLENSELKALPSFLTVEEASLDLRNTKVKKLGANTTISGDLYMQDTAIRELPVNLWIGFDCPSTSRVREYGGRGIYLENTHISFLPDGLRTEELELANTNIQTYGKNIRIVALWLEKALQGNPAELDVEIVRVDGRNQEAVDFAFSLKPGRNLIISNGSPVLPDDMDISCALTIRDAVLKKFPRTAKMNWLELIDTSVPMLPADLQVEFQEIRLEGENTNCGFEDGFFCKKLEIENASITTLPFNYHDVSVADSPIAELPANPFCGGSLYIKDTKIAELPANLEIGSLEIDNSEREDKILLKPSSIVKVDKTLRWTYFPFEAWPANLSAFGKIALPYGCLRELPQGFLVNGNLDLQYNPIENLPENMIIFGDLNISHTAVKHLPKSLRVLGEIHAHDTLIPVDEVKNFTSQGFPVGLLPNWENGKYIHIPGYGNFQILKKEKNKIQIRKICSKDPVWVKNNYVGLYNIFFN